VKNVKISRMRLKNLHVIVTHLYQISVVTITFVFTKDLEVFCMMTEVQEVKPPSFEEQVATDIVNVFQDNGLRRNGVANVNNESDNKVTQKTNTNLHKSQTQTEQNNHENQEITVDPTQRSNTVYNEAMLATYEKN